MRFLGLGASLLHHLNCMHRHPLCLLGSLFVEYLTK
jgi:hypothetical protein